MKNTVEPRAWFPDHQWSANSATLVDQAFFDFDQQAERLVGHDQEYMQLSDGRFHGRFVSCFLGPETALHFEFANQALAQSIAASRDSYSFGVVLSAPEPFRANGVDIDMGAIFVIPPNAAFELYSPQNAAVLAIVIDKERLARRLAPAPYLRDWIGGLDQEIGFLRAPAIADRLRRDALSAVVNSCTVGDHGPEPTWLADALIDSLVAGLILEWGGIEAIMTGSSRNFTRFLEFRHGLDLSQETEASVQSLATRLRVSKRSIQYAFSRELSLGVSSYVLRSRLHRVRRSLLRTADQAGSIGDMAAEHGFWNWSHFSKQYRQLFGERPSDTRRRSVN